MLPKIPTKSPLFHAIEYIKNTNNNATLENFIEDYEPIGKILWDKLLQEGFALINKDNHVELTDRGYKVLQRKD